MHTKQDAANCHYPPSFEQLNQQRTWATPSPSGYQDQMMYSRMTELIKQEE
jgi:hypothetical protein